MSKRNISYIKPAEPSFLRKLKEQIGYKEGPTVDTKRQVYSDSDDDDISEEQPTVVVLQPGDLTAEEAAKEKALLEKEASEASADLSQKILFKSKKTSDENKGKKREQPQKECKTKEKRMKKNLLSFDAEEEDSE